MKVDNARLWQPEIGIPIRATRTAAGATCCSGCRSYDTTTGDCHRHPPRAVGVHAGDSSWCSDFVAAGSAEPKDEES